MRLHRNPEVSVRKIDNELFVYNREKALIHTFNRTGVLLWEAIGEGLDKEEIVGRMTETFEVDAEEAGADLAAFVGKLKELGLLNEVSE